MPRYKLILEYDGTPYRGWQRQENLPSVQQALEEAMARFAQHEVKAHAAGRTDTGVHALGQVCHLNWTEGAEANVQGQVSVVNTFQFQPFHQLPGNSLADFK